jgi:sterol desaturase/sphingolipid hydroxylase (fatty acid hydroxylase superfamily)
MAGLWDARARVGGLNLAYQIAIAFIALDFLSYWFHRAYHRIPLLWSLHLFHHTSEHLDWLSTLRVHPFSQMLNTASMSCLLLLAGLPLKAVVVGNAIIGFSAVLSHANVPWTFGLLRYVFVSPLFHHCHHSRQNAGTARPQVANFGAALSIWDYLFGTALTHSDQPPSCYGVERAPASTFWSLLLYPLRFLLRRP